MIIQIIMKLCVRRYMQTTITKLLKISTSHLPHSFVWANGKLGTGNGNDKWHETLLKGICPICWIVVCWYWHALTDKKIIKIYIHLFLSSRVKGISENYTRRKVLYAPNVIHIWISTARIARTSTRRHTDDKMYQCPIDVIWKRYEYHHIISHELYLGQYRMIG